MAVLGMLQPGWSSCPTAEITIVYSCG
jgi:hypothetical protein